MSKQKRPTNEDRVWMAYVRGCRTVAEVAEKVALSKQTCGTLTCILVRKQYLRRLGRTGRSAGCAPRELFYEVNYHAGVKR